METAVYYTMKVVKQICGPEKFDFLLSKDLSLSIFGDNCFYSQLEALKERELPLLSSSFTELPSYNHISTLDKVKKTGLGSSAALVTSIVSSLLQHFGVVDLPTKEAETSDKLDSVRRCHNLAQFCHCLAQGKIGSGFDVSSACYGSQIYESFSSKSLDSILQLATKDLLDTCSLLERLEFGNEGKGAEKSCWDNKWERFALPGGMELVLGDICLGSETPSMARKVLEAKKNESTKDRVSIVWRALASLNKKTENLFSELIEIETKDKEKYERERKVFSAQKHDQWDSHSEIGKVLHNLRSTFLEIRSNLKLLGDLSEKTPIEPDVQTQILDRTMEFPGVLFAGVPGAGGFDALFAIVLDASLIEKAERMWNTLSSSTIVPLPVRASGLGICQETE